LGKTQLEEHEIIVTEENLPIKQKHYPISPTILKLVYDELSRMLSLGVIEESNSSWSSPVALVRKGTNNGLCLHVLNVNHLTTKYAYPLPHIEGLLSRLQDTLYISAIDLKDAGKEFTREDSVHSTWETVVSTYSNGFLAYVMWYSECMQRTPPYSPVTNSNTNNVIDLIFDNNSIQQNSDASTRTINTRTLYFNEHLSTSKEILVCAVKLPPFWSNCPYTWFIQAEVESASKGVTQDATKYELILIALSQKIITSVIDLIRNPPATNKYE
uniref:DUF7041 domain-containing protein n=1 Tax=Glossina morsitans morsitans TaxID=37546 RepID=A0A1B0GD19_GLOMM